MGRKLLPLGKRKHPNIINFRFAMEDLPKLKILEKMMEGSNMKRNAYLAQIFIEHINNGIPLVKSTSVALKNP